MTLANTGAQVCDNFHLVTNNAKAKVGEIDEQIRNSAKACSEEVVAKTRELDTKFGLTEKATKLGVPQAMSSIAEKASNASAQAENIKIQIAEKATKLGV